MRVRRSEASVVALGVAVILAARLCRVPDDLVGLGVPLMIVSFAWGMWREHLPLLALAVVLVVVLRCGSQVDALARPLPVGTISGEARIVTDPVQRDFDVQTVVAMGGRSYVATIPTAGAAGLKAMQVGETAYVHGTAVPLDGAPVGWVLSNHLAGRLKLRSADRAAAAPAWYGLANGIRRLISRSGASMKPEDRSLYLGLVVGDDRQQSELQKYRFRASGLSHLLAVSGQNVAFVLAIAAPLTRRLGPRFALGVAVPLLTLFTLITRAEPSVLRAVTMAGVALVAVATGRQIQGVRILSMTVIGLVLIDPLITHSMAFILSVSATVGLIVLSEPISTWLRGPPLVTEPLSVTIAAQIATAPVLFTMTGTLPSVATVANLAAVPVSGFVMMAGLTVGLFAGTVRSDVAAVLMWPVSLMVRWVGWVADVASRLPMAQLTPIKMVVVVIVPGVVTIAIRWMNNDGVADRTTVILKWMLRCVGTGVIVMLVLPRPLPPGRFELDGGATLLRSTCGDSVLVIAKGARGVQILEAMDNVGVTDIDLVVPDHSRSAQRAAQYVAQQYRRSRIVDSGVVDDVAAARDRDDRADRADAPIDDLLVDCA